MEQPENSNNSLENVCKDPAGLSRQIYDWLVRGESELAIADACAEHLDRDQVRVLIGAVYDDFFRLMKSDPQSLHGWTLAAAKNVYQKMYAIGDFAGCLKAIKEIRSIAEKMVGDGGENKAPRLADGEDVPEADVSKLPALDLNA